MAYSSSTSMAKAEEWLNCEVCGLTFKNEKHYSIHCGGTFHANRVAASIRAASQNPSKTNVDSQPYTSSNPSYWTGLQQSFSDKTAAEPARDKSLRAQGQSDSTAYPTQTPEYVSYPVGKHAKPTSGGNTGDGYEGMYGMPGFGWSNAPSGQGQGLDDGGGNQSHYGEWEPEPRQASKAPSRPAEQSPWDGGYYSSEGPTAGQGFPGAAKKPQESARAAQKSDVPAWYRIIEPAVSNSQRTEPYGLSERPALNSSDGGPQRHDGGTRRPVEHGVGWNNTGSDLDISGKLRQLRDEGSSRKGKDPANQSVWDAGGYMTGGGREQGRDDRGTRGHVGRFGEGGESGQAGRIGEADPFRNSDFYGGLDARNREELSRRRDDNFTGMGHKDGFQTSTGMGRKDGFQTSTGMGRKDGFQTSAGMGHKDDFQTSTGMGRKDGFQASSRESETSYYRDDQSGRREMFAARLLEKQREDAGRREERSQSGYGHLEPREPASKMGRYEEVDSRDFARAEFESKLLQMQQQNKRNTMPWDEPQDDWDMGDFGESAWADVGAGRGKADAKAGPFGATRGFTMTGTSRAPPTNETQDMRRSGGRVATLGSVGTRPDLGSVGTRSDLGSVGTRSDLGSVGTRPDQRPAWDGQRWSAGYGSERDEQSLGLGSGNSGSIDSRLKQLSAASQKRDAEMAWKDQWGGGKPADEGRAPDRTATFSRVDRPGVGRGQQMAGSMNVGRGAGGGQSGDRTLGGQLQGVGRDGDGGGGSRERNQGAGGVRNSFGASGASRTPDQFPGVSGLGGAGQASAGFPKAPSQNTRGAVGAQNLRPALETSRASTMSLDRGAPAVGRGAPVRPESGPRAPVSQQKVPGYPTWSEAPSRSQGSAAVAKSSVASQKSIPSLLDMNLSSFTPATKKEEQLPRDSTANQKNPSQAKIQLGSKPEKESNIMPRRDSDKTPVTATAVKMSQAVTKTTASIGQAISGKIVAKPPALSGGLFGKPPGVTTPTTLATPMSQPGKAPTALATPTSQAGKSVPSFPPTSQAGRGVPSGPPTSQAGRSVPSGPPTSQAGRGVPPTSQAGRGVPSGPPTSQAGRGVPSGPPTSQAGRGVPPGPPTSQAGRGVPSGPPTSQPGRGVPSGPPTLQAGRGVPSGPLTSPAGKGVPPGPLTSLAGRGVPSGPPTSQAGRGVPSGPPTSQAGGGVPSGPPTSQAGRGVPPGPPTSQAGRGVPPGPPTSQAGKGVPPGPGKPQSSSALATWANEMLVKSAVVGAAASKPAISPGKSSLLPTPASSRVVVTQPSPVQDTSGRKALLPTPNSAGQGQSDPGWSRYTPGGDVKNKTDGGEAPAKNLPVIKTAVVASGANKTTVQGIPIRSPATLDSKVTPTASTASGVNITEAVKTVKNPTASSAGPRPAPALPAGPLGGLQKAPVPGVRSGKKDAGENFDEFDPALSEAVGQFFSDDSAVLKTVKAMNSAKVPSSVVASNVAAEKPKDVGSAVSRSAEPVKPRSAEPINPRSAEPVKPRSADPVKPSQSSESIAPKSSNEPVKKSDSVTSKPDPKQPPQVGVRAGVVPAVKKAENRSPVLKPKPIKIEPEPQEDQDDRDQRRSSDHDPISELSKYLPPEIMREITSGQPPKELLERVADLLPADVLLQAVEFLTNCNAVREARTPAVEALKDATRVKPGGGSASGTSRIQVIAPRKGLANSGKLDPAMVPLSKLAVDQKSGPVMEPVKHDPLDPRSARKRKYDIDISKFKDLSVEDMLKLFQELLQDVLGSLFDDEKKCSIADENKILAGLSPDDRNLALNVRRATGISDISKIVHTLNVLKSLDSQTVLALGQLDKSVISSSLSGNERAQAMGVTVLQQITELMSKGNSVEKTMVIGVPGSVDQARRPAPSASGGAVRPSGVQSLLSLGFSGPAEASKAPGAVRPPRFPANSAAGLLPTPPGMPQNSKAFSGPAPFSGSGLLPTPPRHTAIGNFPAAKRKMAPSSDGFFCPGPEPKRWR